MLTHLELICCVSYVPVLALPVHCIMWHCAASVRNATNTHSLQHAS